MSTCPTYPPSSSFFLFPSTVSSSFFLVPYFLSSPQIGRLQVISPLPFLPLGPLPFLRPLFTFFFSYNYTGRPPSLVPLLTLLVTLRLSVPRPTRRCCSTWRPPFPPIFPPSFPQTIIENKPSSFLLFSACPLQCSPFLYAMHRTEGMIEERSGTIFLLLSLPGFLPFLSFPFRLPFFLPVGRKLRKAHTTFHTSLFPLLGASAPLPLRLQTFFPFPTRISAR